MKQRTLGWLALACAVTTALWVVLVIADTATRPPADTVLGLIESLTPLGPLFYVTYVNAALITVLDVALFAGLTAIYRKRAPVGALIGAAFIPMYGLGNLIVYLSQIFVVPGLLALYRAPATADTALVLLGLTLQLWSASALGTLNLLSYALLGVPSVMLGGILAREGGALRAAGLLLILSGGLSAIALVGVALQNAALSAMTLVSGGVFLIALVLLAIGFLRR